MLGLRGAAGCHADPSVPNFPDLHGRLTTMKLHSSLRALLAVGLLAGGLLALWACSAPVKVGVKVSALGFAVDVGVDSGGNPVANVTGSLDPGKCMRITFSDSTGAEIGSVTIPVPGSCQIPAGAVRQSFEIVNCPPPPDPAAPTGSGAIAWGRAIAVPGWREIFSFPIAPQGGVSNGVVCHARVWCSAGQSASDLLRPVLAAGPGSPVPPTVDVQFFADTIPGPSGATLRCAAQEPILALRFDWNGTTGFGDLGGGVNSAPQTLANGWFAVESWIGDNQTNSGLGQWNGGTITIRTLNQHEGEKYTLAYQNLAF